MKKSLLSCTAAVIALSSSVLLPSCNERAIGLEQESKTEKQSAYEDLVKSGTSTASADTPASPVSTPVTPKAPAPPAPNKEVVSKPPPPPPTPEIKPAPTPTPTPPPPAPTTTVVTPAPTPTPTPAPAPAPAVTTTGGKFSIKPAMPKPLFAGTPLPDNNPPPNLDKTGKPTLEVEVPAGVTLLSKGKPVTTSDPAPLGDVSLITDGDKEGDDGYFVDILPGKQWVQVDLGESKEIHLLWVWHYHKVAAIYKDVVAQISDDPEFKTSTTVFNNDFDDSSKFGVGTDQSWVETNNGRPMPVKGVKGRYVRFYSNGRNVDDTNHYIEVEVYGK